MATYKFKFQKVLDYRKSIEEQKKLVLSKSLKKYFDEKKALESLYSSLYKSNEILQQQAINGTTIAELRNIHEEQEFYREGIKQKNIEVAKAEEELKRSRNDLIKAMKNKKILEKLNEIQYDQFLYNEKQKFEKQIDELTAFKYSKK
ncbi:MAG TPA: flagellar export protein FliJ [Clostridiales bacterium]|nr:flagellar export protein FliJ [Clostridiales bacterium]